MFSSDSGSVHRDTFELKYVIECQGQSAIIIGSSLYYSKSFSQNLRKHLRIVFIDWRGFAKSVSKRGDSGISLNTFIEDIESIRL